MKALFSGIGPESDSVRFVAKESSGLQLSSHATFLTKNTSPEAKRAPFISNMTASEHKVIQQMIASGFEVEEAMQHVDDLRKSNGKDSIRVMEKFTDGSIGKVFATVGKAAAAITGVLAGGAGMVSCADEVTPAVPDGPNLNGIDGRTIEIMENKPAGTVVADLPALAPGWKYTMNVNGDTGDYEITTEQDKNHIVTTRAFDYETAHNSRVDGAARIQIIAEREDGAADPVSAEFETIIGDEFTIMEVPVPGAHHVVQGEQTLVDDVIGTADQKVQDDGSYEGDPEFKGYTDEYQDQLDEYSRTARNTAWQNATTLGIIADSHPDLKMELGTLDDGDPDNLNEKGENRIVNTRTGLVFYAFQGSHPEDDRSVIGKIGGKTDLFLRIDKGVSTTNSFTLSHGEHPAGMLSLKMIAGLLANSESEEDAWRTGRIISDKILADLDLRNLNEDHSNLSAAEQQRLNDTMDAMGVTH